MATKAALRTALLAERRARSPADLAAARAAIRAHVLLRCREVGWACVAAYVPLRTEPGSDELLDGLQALGVRVLVPITRPDKDLEWRTGDEHLDVDAIRTADAVLLPALAVAADGTRLGRGGGSYDRALARCPPSVARIALLFDGEVRPTLPRDPWDRPVSAVVTPSGWTDVGGNTRVATPG